MNNNDIIKLPMTFAQFKYLLTQYGDDEVLKPILMDKLIAMCKHDLYGKYKTATDEAERQKARRDYLDMIGVPKSFRW